MHVLHCLRYSCICLPSAVSPFFAAMFLLECVQAHNGIFVSCFTLTTQASHWYTLERWQSKCQEGSSHTQVTSAIWRAKHPKSWREARFMADEVIRQNLMVGACLQWFVERMFQTAKGWSNITKFSLFKIHQLCPLEFLMTTYSMLTDKSIWMCWPVCACGWLTAALYECTFHVPSAIQCTHWFPLKLLRVPIGPKGGKNDILETLYFVVLGRCFFLLMFQPKKHQPPHCPICQASLGVPGTEDKAIGKATPEVRIETACVKKGHMTCCFDGTDSTYVLQIMCMCCRICECMWYIHVYLFSW